MLSRPNLIGLMLAVAVSSTAEPAVQFKNKGDHPVQLAVAFEHGGKWIKYGWNTIAPGETRRLNAKVSGTILYFAKDSQTEEEVGRTTDPFSGQRTTLPTRSRFVRTWQTLGAGRMHEFRLLQNSDQQIVDIGRAEVITQTIDRPAAISDRFGMSPPVGAQAPGQESNSFEWMLDADIEARSPVADTTTKGKISPESTPAKTQTPNASASQPGKPMAVENVPDPSSTRTLKLYIE